MSGFELSALLAAEERFWRAAGDPELYAAGLADGVLHILPGMGILGSDAVLGGVASAAPWQSFDIREPRMIEIGERAAALVYTACAVRAGEPPYRAAITSVYRRADGRLLLVLHQQTRIG